MADDIKTPAAPKAPDGPDWSKLAAARLLRPLSAMAVDEPPNCVKCRKPVRSCCDGTLDGEHAGFVPICEPCYRTVEAPKAKPAPAPSQEV